MICDKCGSKVSDNEIYCPVCNSKIEKNDNDIDMCSYKPKNIKKIVLISLAVIVVAGAYFYNSDTGKFWIATYKAGGGKYEEAYSIVLELSGNKAEAKQDYYKLLIDIKDIQNRVPVYLEDRYPLSSVGSEVTDKEMENVHWGENTESSNLKVSDYTNVIDNIREVEDEIYLLSESEKTVFNDYILSPTDNLSLYTDDRLKFTEYLKKACDVYDDIEYYEDGGRYVSNEKIEDTKEYADSLEKARSIYYEATDENFYGYDEVLATINATSRSLNKGLEEFGGDAVIYYTEIYLGEDYPSPYGINVSINDVENEMYEKILRNWINSIQLM